MLKSISKLKKELDKWFSLFIRLREATDEGLVSRAIRSVIISQGCKTDTFNLVDILLQDLMKLIAKCNA